MSDRLEYGVSLTDACVGWESTARLLEAAYEALSAPALAAR